jgi:hypothetical protein
MRPGCEYDDPNGHANQGHGISKAQHRANDVHNTGTRRQVRTRELAASTPPHGEDEEAEHQDEQRASLRTASSLSSFWYGRRHWSATRAAATTKKAQQSVPR